VLLTAAERETLGRVARATLDGRRWAAWDLAGGPRAVRSESVVLAGLFRKGLVDRERSGWGGFAYSLSPAFREILAAEFVARACTAGDRFVFAGRSS